MGKYNIERINKSSSGYYLSDRLVEFDAEEPEAYRRADDMSCQYFFGVGLVRLEDGLVDVGNGWMSRNDAEAWLSSEDQ